MNNVFADAGFRERAIHRSSEYLRERNTGLDSNRVPSVGPWARVYRKKRKCAD
jgi:hypothetical protein